MSLINDALKRAQQAPQPPPAGPVPNPHLKPAEASGSRWQGLGLAVPLALAGFALLLLVLYWRLSHRDVLARSEPPPPAATVAATEHPASTAPSEPDVSTPATPAATTAHPDPGASATTNTALPIATTNGTAVAEAPVKPALPRLQGIIYNPGRSSAVLSGHTVFVGDRFGTYRVVAISHDSATLVGGGETNLLTLQP